MGKTKAWVADIETYSNLFTIVCESIDGEVLEFVFHESRDDFDAFIDFLKTRPAFIGYNWLGFDAQVIEHIWRNKIRDPRQIYQFVQDMMDALSEDRFNLPYTEWQLSFQCLDLYKMMHYDNNARRTSLKWLEFTTRQKSIADLPIHHEDEVTEKQIPDILKYNRYDVSVTKEFYKTCEKEIQMRKELFLEYGESRITSMSDSSIGSYIFANILSKELGVPVNKLKKQRTPRKRIDARDLILPYIKFETHTFQSVLDFYMGVTVKQKKGKIILKGVVEHSVNFDGMDYDFGAGGLHGARGNQIFEENEEYEILSIDAKSYYPHLSFLNGIYPEHLGPKFCPVFEGIFKERAKHPKGSTKNASYKIVLNGSYGNTNSEYSFLYDPAMTLSICINGQLSLCMLAEKVTFVGGKVIMANTDGLEVMVPRAKKDLVLKACKEWEEVTKQILEYDSYKKIFLRDCNNYIGVFTDGSVKRKGQFVTYEDIVASADWHKNPSASIIPKAISEYVVNGVPVEDTVMSENNIHEFLYGAKKTKAFDYIWWVAEEGGIVRPKKKITDRVVRYYASKNGGNLYKHWNDGRITGLNVGQLVTPAQKLRSTRAELFTDIDRQYYINQAKSIIEETENQI